MRSLKDASGQYRNFSAGSLPESEALSGASRKHMQTQNKHKRKKSEPKGHTKKHEHARGAGLAKRTCSRNVLYFDANGANAESSFTLLFQ